MINKDLREKILRYSFSRSWAHIPSALSQCDFMKDLFSVIDPYEFKFVFGKFYGSQGVYIPLAETHNIDVESLSYFLSPKELPFIVENSYTIADSLGFAIGYSMGTGKRTIVTVTDGVLQSGYMYEAFMLLKKFNPNVLVLIDNNNMQVCSHTSDIVNIEPMLSMISTMLPTSRVNGHGDNKALISDVIARPGAQVIIFDTIKGCGVPDMENNDLWHYRKISSETELNSLIASIR